MKPSFSLIILGIIIVCPSICLADQWPGACVYIRVLGLKECDSYETVKKPPGEEPIPYGVACGPPTVDENGVVHSPIVENLSSVKFQAYSFTTYYWDRDHNHWVGVSSNNNCYWQSQCYPVEPFDSPWPADCSEIPDDSKGLGPPPPGLCSL